MPITGKYDFKGFQKAGVSGLRLALGASPKTAWLLKFSALTNFVAAFFSNWLANNGLLILNVGTDIIEGHLDQVALDKAMDKALSEITNKGGRDKLSPEQKRKIDDEVIKAARKFLIIGRQS